MSTIYTFMMTWLYSASLPDLGPFLDLMQACKLIQVTFAPGAHPSL